MRSSGDSHTYSLPLLKDALDPIYNSVGSYAREGTDSLLIPVCPEEKSPWVSVSGWLPAQQNTAQDG